MCTAYLRSMFIYSVKEGSRLMSFPYWHYFNIKQEQHNRHFPIVKHWTHLLQIKSLLVSLFLDSLFCDVSLRIPAIFFTSVLCISKINFISSCQFLQLNKLGFFLLEFFKFMDQIRKSCIIILTSFLAHEHYT